jgi:hypothetical protein
VAALTLTGGLHSLFLVPFTAAHPMLLDVVEWVVFALLFANFLFGSLRQPNQLIGLLFPATVAIIVLIFHFLK